MCYILPQIYKKMIKRQNKPLYILPFIIYFYKYWQTLFRSFKFLPKFLTTNRTLSRFFTHIMHSEWSKIIPFSIPSKPYICNNQQYKRKEIVNSLEISIGKHPVNISSMQIYRFCFYPATLDSDKSLRGRIFFKRFDLPYIAVFYSLLSNQNI